MKIKTLTYAMLRSTAQYENDRVEVTMEVDEKDNLGDVVRRAKRVCAAALVVEATPSFEEMVGDDSDALESSPATIARTRPSRDSRKKDRW